MKNRRDNETTDLFNRPWPKRERPAQVPHQPSSAESKAAAEKISPVFHGNRQACFRAIASGKDVTRKSIAAAYFEGMQHFVTGPVRVLIDQGLVYEEPARDRHGAIMMDGDRIVHRKVEGSAVLLLTPKGRAVAA